MTSRIITLLIVLLLLSQCKHPSTSSGSSLLTTQITLPNPTPNGKLTLSDEQIDFIVAAMVTAHDVFYVTGSGYLQTPNGKKVPPEREINTSYDAGQVTGRWSALMSLYYGLFPSYEGEFFPNIRECFTSFVSPLYPSNIDGKKPNYEDAYQFCVFMPIDRQGVVERGKLYNWANSLVKAPPLDQANVSSDKAVGPLAWIHRNQESVFKFILYGGKCGIDVRTEQAILDRFRARLPSTSELLDFKPKAEYCP